MNNLFFVYGSLKRGCWNNHYLGDSEFIGEAYTLNTFVLTDCGFPYMIPSQSLSEDVTEAAKLPVVGEVYKVTDPAVEAALDRLEGVSGGHYERKVITVAVGTLLCPVTAYIPCDVEMALQYPTCGIDHRGFYQWKE